jgi:type VI secretion system protein ImpK
MKRIQEVTYDCFNALIQLRNLDEAALPTAEVLRSRFQGFIDALFQRAQQAGFSREEVNDVAYALVALADQFVMSKSESIREDWGQEPLQLHYFQETVAGEAFFTRLDTIRKNPRKKEILYVYYLALLFGFEGRYRVHGGDIELKNLVESIRQELGLNQSTAHDPLSPHPEHPPLLVQSRSRKKLVLTIGAGTFALALVLFLVLYIYLGASTDQVVNQVKELSTTFRIP